MLELYEVVKTQLVVACPNVFLIFYDRGRHAGLLTLIKNASFKCFWSLWFVFSWFWASPGANHTAFDKNQESVFHSFLSNTFSFLFEWKATGKSAQT